MISIEDFKELIKSARTVRRFREEIPLSQSILKELINLTRYCPSGRNAQPLRYRIVSSAEEKELLFPPLKWAGYFSDWDGPEPGERPSAYLIQCLDTHFGADCLCDDGLQLEAITLGMHCLGLAGCIIKAFNAAAAAEILNIPPRYQPRYILALGHPAERVIIEDMPHGDDADFKYFRSADGTHHVPKRPLDDLII